LFIIFVLITLYTVYYSYEDEEMRLTDDRYSGERRQFELALRMIGHEARTRTIRDCTGLSDDRIRKLYSRYFSTAGRSGIKRRASRGCAAAAASRRARSAGSSRTR